MAEFLTALTGFFKFFDQVVGFIKLLEKTPLEKRADAIKAVNDAFSLVNKPNPVTGKPSGDTGGIERILN